MVDNVGQTFTTVGTLLVDETRVALVAEVGSGGTERQVVARDFCGPTNQTAAHVDSKKEECQIKRLVHTDDRKQERGDRPSLEEYHLQRSHVDECSVLPGMPVHQSC